jgi:hypothetical protein
VVSNGTLRVNGTISGSGVTVTAGATLDGIGVVNTTITVDSGATLAAGNPIGLLTINGAATLNGTVVAEVTNGPSADLINFDGGATLGGTLTVSALGTLISGQTFNLFDGSLSGTFTTLNLPGGLGHWDTTALYTAGELTFNNTTPVAANFSGSVAAGGSATLVVVGKFATDADGDTLTITSVSTPANGTATIVGGNILYTSTTGASDSFTYTVNDGLGGTATGTATIQVYAAEGFNKLSGPTGTGPYSFSYLGIPNEDYALEESPNLVPPYTWTPVVTNTAAANGALDFNGVTLTYPSGSFRTRHVP